MDDEPEIAIKAYQDFTRHLSKGNNISAAKILDDAKSEPCGQPRSAGGPHAGAEADGRVSGRSGKACGICAGAVWRSSRSGGPVSGSSRASPRPGTSRAWKRPGPDGGANAGCPDCRPPFHSTNRPGRTSALRVILDDFSALAFGYEWTTSAVHPHTWRSDLASGRRRPPVCRVGLGGKRRPVARQADRPRRTQQRVPRAGPVVPGAKGSPRSSGTRKTRRTMTDFLPAARLFDHVFTSDSGRIAQYTEDLGHDRVAVLPFAAQPAIHNPVRPGHGRHQRDVAFAGMYFAHKYPERRAQMDLLLGGALDASARMKTGLEIFSRQLGGNAEYQFPAPLDSRVVGSLTYAQTLSAYKAYKVFLNVNSVVDSPSMCARRIFEISASGTPVITAPSAGHGTVLHPRGRARGRHPQGGRAPHPGAGFQPGAERPHGPPGPTDDLVAPHLLPTGRATVLQHAVPALARPRVAAGHCPVLVADHPAAELEQCLPDPGRPARRGVRNWCCSPTASSSPPNAWRSCPKTLRARQRRAP